MVHAASEPSGTSCQAGRSRVAGSPQPTSRALTLADATVHAPSSSHGKSTGAVVCAHARAAAYCGSTLNGRRPRCSTVVLKKSAISSARPIAQRASRGRDASATAAPIYQAHERFGVVVTGAIDRVRAILREEELGQERQRDQDAPAQQQRRKRVRHEDFHEEGQLLAPLAVDEPVLRTLRREAVSVLERVVRRTVEDGEAERHGAEPAVVEDDRDGAEPGQKPGLVFLDAEQ